jgi:hypothetical protein
LYPFWRYLTRSRREDTLIEMKEYADEVKSKVDATMGSLSNVDELGLYSRLGQLTEVRKTIVRFRREGLLDEKEVEVLEKLESDGCQLLRSKLPQS